MTTPPPHPRGHSQAEGLVACLDGPMAGHWYTTADWRERLTAAAAMAAHHQPATAINGYTCTGEQVTHPHNPALTGTAWTTTPTTAGSSGDSRPAPGSPLAELPAAGAGPVAAPARASGAASTVRVLVTGSRTWDRPDAITAALEELRAALAPGQSLTLVHGANPRGADAIADTWARHHPDDVTIERHPADWRAHGRAAGMIRNTAMTATGPHVCLAFIRDASPGATHCARTAEHAGIPTHRWTHPTTDAGAETVDAAADDEVEVNAEVDAAVVEDLLDDPDQASADEQVGLW